MLNEKESEHYKKHLNLTEIGETGQLKLKEAKVLVVGAGGLGCPTLLYLAAAGIGTLGIVDGDIIEGSNLQRQVLYSYENIGQSKAFIAREKLSLLNPNIFINTHDCFLNMENALSILSDYDLIVDGSDNFETRYLLNDACVILNKTLVYGALFKFEGQISVFNHKGGPTYRCLYPNVPTAAESPNCNETGVLGVLPGIIGSMQALECIKIICEIGIPLSGTLLIFNGLKMSTKEISFTKNLKIKISELTNYKTPGCNKTTFKDISVEEASNLLKTKKDILLIDVRETHEFEADNIGGKNLPLSSIQANTSLSLNKNMASIIHCQSGKRSLKACEILSKRGYKLIYNLKGGLKAWKRSNKLV